MPYKFLNRREFVISRYLHLSIRIKYRSEYLLMQMKQRWLDWTTLANRFCRLPILVAFQNETLVVMSMRINLNLKEGVILTPYGYNRLGTIMHLRLRSMFIKNVIPR